LISWDESYFWNKQQDQFLPLGEITDKALLHHHQHTVFSEQWLESVYENKLNRKLLEEQGGYLKENKPNTDPDFNAYQDYWWNKGLVQHYFNATQPERFYLPYQTKNDFAENPQPPQIAQIDGLKVKTVVSYDQYYLLPIQIENYITDTERMLLQQRLIIVTLTHLSANNR
jgi:hypothetical protein